MRGGGEEGGFWVLPASSPSPIVVVGCSCRLSRQFRLSGPDRGRWDSRDPTQAITFLTQLSGRTKNESIISTAMNVVMFCY